MNWIETLRKGRDELLEVVVEGWEKLRRSSASGLTRFTRGKDAPRVEGVPDSEETWGLLSADVCDAGGELVVRLEAPGMDRDDFQLSVERGCLIVRGEKRFEQERQHGQYHLFESAYGMFERAVPLPSDVNAAEAKATYKRGILMVHLPKTQGAAAKRIPIAD